MSSEQRTAHETLIRHVGCGDVDAMVGCPLCDQIRAALRAAPAPTVTQDRMYRCGRQCDHIFSFWFGTCKKCGVHEYEGVE
jgi:hypothetical protein